MPDTPGAGAYAPRPTIRIGPAPDPPADEAKPDDAAADEDDGEAG